MIEIDWRDDGVAVLSLDHGKVNALDVDLLERIITAFGEVADAAAVVLTGSRSNFSAGVDLRRIEAGTDKEITHFLDVLSRALLTAFTHPRPVVAAINGHAIAGGCVLAVAADVRMMSGGTMGLTEVRVGVPFPTAALEIVRHAAGVRAQSLVLSGRLIEPADAVALGLVDRAVAPDELLPAAIAEAVRLADIPAETFAITKRQLHGPAMAALAHEYEIYDATVARTWASDSGRGAVSAFLASLHKHRAQT